MMKHSFTLSLNRIADHIQVTDEKKQLWLDNIGQFQVSKRRNTKPIILIAILVALALGGFGYARSANFEKIIHPLPAMPPNTVDAREDITEHRDDTTGKLEGAYYHTRSLDQDQAHSLLDGLLPGEILESTVNTGEGDLYVKAMRGDTLDVVMFGPPGEAFYAPLYFSRDGSPIPNENWQIRTEKPIDAFIDAGGFVPELAGPGYVLEEISTSNTVLSSLLYRTPTGRQIQVSPYADVLFMHPEAYNSQGHRDLTIAGRTFTVMESEAYPDDIQLYLYLENTPVKSISFYPSITESDKATLEDLLAAAEHLVIHNPQAHLSTEVFYDEAFFSQLADPILRDHAGEIAQALRTDSRGEPGLAPVWEKDGRQISIYRRHFGEVYQEPDHIEIDYSGIETSSLMDFYAIPGVSNPFVREPWYAIGDTVNGSVSFQGGVLTWFSVNDKTKAFYALSRNTYYTGLQSELDALVVSLSPSDSNIRLVPLKSGMAVVGELAAAQAHSSRLSITTVQRADGHYYTHSLTIVEDLLPEDTIEEWVARNLTS